MSCPYVEVTFWVAILEETAFFILKKDRRSLHLFMGHSAWRALRSWPYFFNFEAVPFNIYLINNDKNFAFCTSRPLLWLWQVSDLYLFYFCQEEAQNKRDVHYGRELTKMRVAYLKSKTLWFGMHNFHETFRLS